jgi:hypothetical protein
MNRQESEQAVIRSTTREKDTKCTYNVALGLVRVIIVAVEKQYVLHILSVSLWP